MNVQVIARDGEPEYAVLPWAEYQELLSAAGRQPAGRARVAAEPPQAAFELANLRSLREARGLALEQLARDVGISPHYLGLIESGEREPDQAIRRALARVFTAAGEGQPG
jgi:DNA-binding XRE family transcriptional regulator